MDLKPGPNLARYLKAVLDLARFKNLYAKVDFIGIRVPRNTGAPLCTPGLISTSGHSSQSIFSLVAIGNLPVTMIPRFCSDGPRLRQNERMLSSTRREASIS